MVIFHDFPSSHVSLFKGENSFQALRNVICGLCGSKASESDVDTSTILYNCLKPPIHFLTFSKHIVDLQNPHNPQTPPKPPNTPCGSPEIFGSSKNQQIHRRNLGESQKDLATNIWLQADQVQLGNYGICLGGWFLCLPWGRQKST